MQRQRTERTGGSVAELDAKARKWEPTEEWLLGSSVNRIDLERLKGFMEILF